jgi:hypothetical protein
MSDPQPDGETQQPANGAVKAAQIGTQPPPPPKKTFLQRLFDPATRFGRGMRAFTRGLGLVVGLYALGLLTTYILLFQPLERRYRAAQAQLAQSSAALESLQADLKLAQTSLSGAEDQRKAAADALAKTQPQVDVQRANVAVLKARLALAQKDNTAVRLALNEAETVFTALKPAVSTASSQSLEQVLGLARSDLSRDARLADEDLQRLLSELELIQQSMN